ncbi:MAG: DUF4230 domain-containing protein [Lachnospiraceae bacterium]|jgi:hypothetical protein
MSKEHTDTQKRSGKANGIVGMIAAILLLVMGGVIYPWFHELQENKETGMHSIKSQLENTEEFITQVLTYTGYMEVAKNKLPSLTKSKSFMKYTATVSAGIDLSKSTVQLRKDHLIIQIPHAEIVDIKVEADTIELDHKNLSSSDKAGIRDTAAAITLAETDVQKNADYSQLLANADAYAQELIHKLLDGTVRHRDIVISFQ